jgi:prephenate dehydrogenase
VKICVAGLGLIGGSMALALKRFGYKVDGYNRSQAVCAYAKEHHVVENLVTDFSAYDVVIVAMPPKPTINFLTQTVFKKGAVVADICGVKTPIERAVYEKKRDYLYIGLHPMAGKEVSGIQNASESLFDKASMVITHAAQTDERALTLAKQLTKDMGFARIVECTAEVHDRKIAYTSQLAHIVSNAYVKDEEISNCFGFTGGSFQDMTRIAGVDEKVWSSLYLLNGEQITKKISSLVDHLTEIQAAIKSGDEANLCAVLREGRELFELSKDTKEDGEDIVITPLK